MAAILRFVRNALACLGALWVLVTITPVTRWMVVPLAGTWSEPTGEVLIVLGADSPTDGFIGLASYWRTFYALRCWREGGFQNIVVSGGHGVADSMARLLEFEGVPADRIKIERQSTSTRENALLSAPILESLPGRKVLVTGDFHVCRSVRCFAKAGIRVQARLFPYALKRSNDWLDRWPLFLDMCIEYIKIVWYRVHGWI